MRNFFLTLMLGGILFLGFSCGSDNDSSGGTTSSALPQPNVNCSGQQCID